MELIAVINTGSTSTKLAIYGYKDSTSKVDEIIELKKSNISVKGVKDPYKEFFKDFTLRKDAVLEFIEKFLETKNKSDSLICVAARGGLLRSLNGGVYRINDTMVKELLDCKYGNHPSNMAAPIAFEVAKKANIEAFIAYPVITDEMDKLAKYTGLPEIKRKSIFHALNHKAVSRYVARDLGKKYEDLNLIICHMGGGITVGIHVKGNVVDVNNGLDGDGPFSIERSGTVPAGDFLKLCFDGRYSREELMRKIVGNAGIFAYLGKKDARIIEKVIQENIKIDGILPSLAKEVIDACAYKVSKEICSLAAYTGGRIDAIVLTGGLAYFKYLTEEISNRVSFVSKVLIYPGENELKALAEYSFLALNGKEKIFEYGS